MVRDLLGVEVIIVDLIKILVYNINYLGADAFDYQAGCGAEKMHR